MDAETFRAAHPAVGRYCIIRTQSAGVHAGIVTVVSVDGRQVTLVSARRIWQWFGAFTLSEVSQTGIDQEKSRVTAAVPEIYLIEVIEIIPASDAAREIIEACHE